MENKIRSFIAIKTTADLRKELKVIQAELKAKLIGNISWVNPENIHLTLRFLGYIDTEAINQIKNALINTAKDIGQFNISLGSLGVFPTLSNPRVIWTGIKIGNEELNQINNKLEENLKKINFDQREKNFHPHLTIGRIKKIQHKQILKDLLIGIKPKEILSCVDKLILFKSELTPQGAIHSNLFEQKLLVNT